ncbi:hypothetical protein AVE30378_06135 [Achromobacter veterisilvae]|uniref:Uncharacterized protein n=1 Tax=Achromobacter veterisilvae TaxID=2069367 RepID=A0A446D0Z8_9BURK|nr:hypothetical protein AVE30378_06135 [Achromobacter veterisilvae]
MGRRKAPKVAGTSGSGGRNHPWADEQARSSLEPSAVSNHTRPMSWLGPASSGAHPRTKGARFCAGGHRHRIPLTTKGLRVARAAWQATGRPLRSGRKKHRSAERAWRGSQRSYLQFPWPGTAGRDAHMDQEGIARWASRRACGTRATPPMADTAHGKRRAVRSLCGRCGAGVRHRAWTCRIRQAACPCSLDSDCTTKTGRSCHCAGAWARRTAGKPALGEP